MEKVRLWDALAILPPRPFRATKVARRRSRRRPMPTSPDDALHVSRAGAAARRAASRIEPADVALGVGPLVLGTIVGLVTNEGGQVWYRRLSKPSWTPPDAVFGPVWTVLYLLMGAAAVLVRRAGSTGGSRASGSNLALGLFGGQLVLNLLWSIIFFGRRQVRAGLVEIVVLLAALVATVVAFARVRLTAALLLLPYLAWTSFAAVLTAAIARRNPRA
jgi:translocator protein